MLFCVASHAPGVILETAPHLVKSFMNGTLRIAAFSVRLVFFGFADRLAGLQGFVQSGIVVDHKLLTGNSEVDPDPVESSEFLSSWSFDGDPAAHDAGKEAFQPACLPENSFLQLR